MSKRYLLLLFIFLIFFSCKSINKYSNYGSFKIVNLSTKTIEFIWIAPEGEFYPTVESVNVKEGQSYEFQGLKSGLYDIAIDFKDEYNSYNSKKDKSLCLLIEKGLTIIWTVDPSGKINRN